MWRQTGFRLSLGVLSVLLLLILPVTAYSQSDDAALTHLVEDRLEAVALHSTQRIREAKLEEKEPKILVIDFFRSSLGHSSRLGTLLADHLSEALLAYSAGLKIVDRRILKDYLTQNWTTLEDLQSNEVCLQIGRQLGATGVILGTLYEENGQISLTVHLEGFGRVTREADMFEVTDERVRFPVTERTHTMLFESGPNFARKADDIPDEPGVFKGGVNGAGLPRCLSCPNPSYTNAARGAKFQGTILLSIVVTAEGKATSIYVLKGAPFGLTANTIKAVQGWQFEPALKDGNPVPVRVPIESSFRLF